MKKIFRSVPVRLSLRFSILLTTVVIILALTLTGISVLSIRNEKTEELRRAQESVAETLQKNDEFSIREGFPSLPYYIYYTVYLYDENATSTSAEENSHVISTNDSSIPLLTDSDGKSATKFEKDYYIDGDLNILYYARRLTINGNDLVIQTCINMDTDSMSNLVKQLPKAAALLFLPMLLISFFICLFITRHTLRPVVKITDKAKNISSSNLDDHLPLTGKADELDELAGTFNELFSRLKRDFDRERQFTSDVSHELKTPVAVILGQSNLLRRWGKNDPEQLDKSLNTIISETKSMEAIIQNLLQMSRLESGRVLPQMDIIDLKEMFERLKTETLSVNPKVIFNYDENLNVKINADPELLHQVFTVVISNSLKFCGDPIELTIRCMPGNVTKSTVIELEDNGPGFGEENIPHVFERFYRGDEAHTRSAGGSGLGLSIAKTIIESMNGIISAHVASNGHGAMVRIVF
ncbi:MAG: HAMP domain-containing histidine kinase [Treponema sp.]|nr:HAMP domain-containing histidine kinase [Treponema sp.]